jgi:phytoene dehydrogenase-like protein
LPGPRCSIEEYLQGRGFSEQFMERFARPFYGGITLDRSLSTAAGIFRYTFAMLSGGRIAVPADGMGAIPAQLATKAQRAGATIQTDTEVREVEAARDEVLVTTAGESSQADAVVVATDAYTASELTAVERIPTTAKGCTTQYFAVDGGAPFDGEHRLVLNAEGGTPNHVAPLSTVAPEYAPPDRHLVSATTLGTPRMTDEELAEHTTDSIESWYPDHSAEDFTLVETDRIHFAQFDQPPGYHDTLPEPWAPDGPVFLAGDYTHWSSIQGALESGRRAARIVAESGCV